MMQNRRPFSTDSEPLHTNCDEAPWVEAELSANQAPVRGKRILLAEDDEPLRGFLRMMLECDGHRITEASNGAEALSLFSTDVFDIVITDFEMPVIKGNELAVSIKLLAPSLPILMITASARARGNIVNPVDAFLNKPFTMPDLRGALAPLLSARSEPAQPDSVLMKRCGAVLDSSTNCSVPTTA